MKKLMNLLVLLLLGVAILGCDDDDVKAPAVFKINPFECNFNPVNVGDKEVLKMEITNSGDQDLELKRIFVEGKDKVDFSFNGQIKPVRKGEIYRCEMTFEPKTEGEKQATLVVETNVGTYSVKLTGTAKPKPIAICVITPTEYGFGGVYIGEKKSKDITIENKGNADLIINSIELNGSAKDQFALTNHSNLKKLKANDKKSFVVEFIPTSEKYVTGLGIDVIIKTNVGDFNVDISGAVLIPSAEFSISPESYDYGAVEVGKTKTQKFVVTNTGKADLVISKVELTEMNADQFVIEENPGSVTIAPNQTKEYMVAYKPLNMDNTTVMAYFTLHTQIGVEKVQLTGMPLPKPVAICELKPTSYTFEATYVGEENSTTIEIFNKGNAPLTISSITLVGENSNQFKLADIDNLNKVDAGQNTKFTASFAPTNADLPSADAKIKLVTNVGEYFVDVNGKILEKKAICELKPTSYTFEATYVGEENSTTIEIFNKGNAPLTISSITLVGENSNQFKLADIDNLNKVDAGQNTKFTASFAPTNADLPSADAKIKLVTNVGEYFVDLNGKILVKKAICELKPTSYTFEATYVGEENSTTIEIFNKGNAPLTISSITLVGENSNQFKLADIDNLNKVDAGQNTKFTASFAPTNADLPSADAKIKLVTNVGEYFVDVNGKILEKKAICELKPTSYTFEATYVGEENSTTIEIFNKGNAPLTISSITLVGENSNQFKLADIDNLNKVDAGQNTKFTASFAPTNADLPSADAKIKLVTNVGEYFVDVNGKILVKPILRITPNKYGFGKVEIGKTATKVIHIENAGTGELVINAMDLLSEKDVFSLEDIQLPIKIKANNYKDINIKFTPNSEGEKSTEIAVSSNAGDAKVLIAGEGVQKEVSTTIDFGHKETPFKACGDELEVKGIKLIMTSGSKYYVKPAFYGECSSFGMEEDKVYLWPGTIQLDLKNKPNVKSIRLKVEGYAVPVMIVLYDKNKKSLHEEKIGKGEITISYDKMEKVKYVGVFSFEGYIDYITFSY